MQKITKHKGKGGAQEMLPHRKAMTQLTAGDAFQRSINNYAKVTPSGEGALGAPNVMDMSKVEY
ncbi:hypothetical protein IVA80_15275 [Bradyrhizobium sp. 139]|uniref:hypothetical protein n=1 Tax=Bradyrhizobium sp. 139 TaxID=2782616 RepID=UPI001FF802CF|nr:hypothetical protein [Bradyrhizobium sp. 139]MCK1742185.1 hypothetical protein [Bradyrhizobium sp. 139]